MKKQIFNYNWSTPEERGRFKYSRDLTHAIGNSDQYPCGLGENTIQNETIDAVVNAIDSVPEYEMRRRPMVDVMALVNVIRDMPGELTHTDVINTIANLQEEVHDITPVLKEVAYEV